MSILNLFRLDGEVAVVTGGAQGLGEQMCLGLAEAGASVVVADLNLEKAQKVAEHIRDLGVASEAMRVDVTKRDQVEAMVQRTLELFGKIDVLVACAGVGPVSYTHL
ncbi:MAG: SDR family NAD(P)-dependent oxidoreductase, partial [Candidatus Caldatribacterium sp.]|nr:SDR family NAD(P)-dependent oxidoreductase [Candidatus Caldatribacterium sp.]